MLSLALLFSFSPELLSGAGTMNFTLVDEFLPFKMGAFMSALHNKTWYSIGGLSSGTPVNLRYETEYSVEPSSWDSAQISIPLGGAELVAYGQTVAVAEGLIFACDPTLGRVSSYNYQALLVYDLEQGQFWDTSSYDFQYPTGQRVTGMCVTPNKGQDVLYVLGGSISAKYTQYAAQYDYVNDGWTWLADIVTARGFSGCSVDAQYEMAYLFAGRQALNFLDSIEEYDISADTWTQIDAQMTYPIAALECSLFSSYNNSIFCFGGYDSDEVGTSMVQIFNPVDYSVDSTSYALNLERVYFGISVMKDCIYVLGGNLLSGTDFVYYQSMEYLCL